MAEVTTHGTLRFSPYRHPLKEAFHAGAFAPHQGEEFCGVEVGGFFPEECFEAPLDVRRGPGTQAIALRDDPVVAESVQHFQECAERQGVGQGPRAGRMVESAGLLP